MDGPMVSECPRYGGVRKPFFPDLCLVEPNNFSRPIEGCKKFGPSRCPGVGRLIFG